MLIKPSKLVNTAISYIVIYILILTSGHVLSVSGNNNLYIICFIILLFLTFFKTFFANAGLVRFDNYDKTALLLFSGMIVIDFIADLIFGFGFSYSIKFTIVLLLGFLITHFFTFSSFKSYFVNSMTILSLIALVGYAIGLTKGFVYSLPTFENINDVSYYDGGLFFALNSYSRGRNIGVFWEPGIFAIMITLALFFEIFDSKKTNTLKLVIFALSLLTTYSTTGYFLFTLILLAYVYTKKRNNRALMVVVTIIFLGTVVLFIVYGDIQSFLVDKFPRVFSKLFTEQASSIERLNSIKYNFRIFLSNIMGYGITQANYIFSEYSSGSQTSTMTLYFAQFGLYGIMFVIIQLRCILKCKDWKVLQCAFFAVFWVIANNVEIMTMFSIVYVLFIYFLKSTNSIQRIETSNNRD